MSSDDFLSSLTGEEKEFFASFHRPIDIQRFLDTVRYNDGYNWKSPRQALLEGTANCGEGALIAAAAFKFMGAEPLVMDMGVVDDDDHLVALFKHDGHWGAVAKSNTTLLRFREPVFRSVRELAMSYFEFYFNVKGFKSLRRFSLPINLDGLEPRDWVTTAADLNIYNEQFARLPYESILTIKMEENLTIAEPDVRKACFLGASKTGLYVPPGCDIEELV
ncbi:MAG: hypothetical protein RDV48_06210 [Candidatus Eremiobacteraeota bacterium]|nr:hypothetical protein [Candidatus Eremiobacteraeota bacterium]